MPTKDLSQYHWHTGAPVTKLQPDEPIRKLFRDVGPQATVQFLTKGLTRLSGPLTPIGYWRTADYQEPYIDYARIGRIVSLQPNQLNPWHSGVPHVYITDAALMPKINTLAYVTNDQDLTQIESQLQDAQTDDQVREIFGGDDYDVFRQETIIRLQALNKSLQRSEALAHPLRLQLQSSVAKDRDQARQRLHDKQLTEYDLCTAWHHMSESRRDDIIQALSEPC